jgi:HEAT repeat protein
VGEIITEIRPLVRAECREKLGKFKENRTVEPLISLFSDNDEEVRRVAQKSLFGIGPLAVDALINIFNSNANKKRIFAAYMLSQINDSKAISFLLNKDNRALDILIQSLRDKSPYIRNISAMTLGKYKDGKTIEPLISLFSDDDWGVRHVAQESLIEMGSLAVDELINIINSNTKKKRIIAGFTLSQINSPKAATYLKNCINNKDIEVVIGAYEYYIEQGDDSSIIILIDALKKDSSITMAEVFLNCGNWALNEAARKWANDNKYIIIPSSKESEGAIWGKKRK